MNRDLMKLELKQDEGFVGNAYQDSEGYLTIGYGRLIDKRKAGGISEAEADVLLENDIVIRENLLRKSIKFWDQLSDARQRALLNMSFQMGVNGLLGFGRTMLLLGASRFEEAAAEALRSEWATKYPLRAKRVTEMIRTGK